MKKIMNKKMKFFGKEFSVFAFAAVMMVGLASAALVPYLSNAVSATVNVDNPLVMGISKTDGSYAATATLDAVHGGDFTTIYTEIKNNAGVPISGYFTVLITSTATGGATCDDFSAIALNSVSASPGDVGYDTLCDDTTTAETVAIKGTESLIAGETDYDVVVLTFAQNVAPATYTVATRIMQNANGLVDPAN